MALEKFLNENGVSHLWSKINSELSTRDANIKKAQDAADQAQREVDLVEDNIGTLEKLNTTSKDNLVNAINEVRQAVETGGTGSVVKLTEDATNPDYAKVYTLTQGETQVGTINIPKDMVVSSGTVVVLEEGNAEGQPAGTYIKLVLANSDAPLYINAASLVDIYTPQAGATQVQIAISPENIISATIVAGAIGAVELATNAVITEKIVDANVTKVKLSSEVQTSLGKADSAIQKVTIVGHELTDGGVVTVEQVKTALALGSAAYEDASAFEVAGAANAVKNDVIGTATDLASANTIYGAKKYADELRAEITTMTNAEIDQAIANASAA